jgi:sarcosine oxidase subunit beta
LRGRIRYQFSTEINVRLSLESLPMIERFKEEIGQDVDYRRCGYLLVATNEKDAQVFKHNVELQNGLGVQTRLLSGDEVRERLPLMKFEDAIAGTFNPKDGLVDPNGVVAGYVSAAQKLGVRALTRAEVTGICVSGDQVEEWKPLGIIRLADFEHSGSVGEIDRPDGRSPNADRSYPPANVHHKCLERNPCRFSVCH